MQILNFFQMNDAEIRTFYKIVLCFQLAVWFLIFLDINGIQIPIIRQLFCFIYLIFIPGVTILRILNLHDLDNIKTILYSVGLSITILMFTGILINTIYPYFGISRPLSLLPLVITMSIIISLLCILCYRDKNFSNPKFLDFNEILSPKVLFLCLLPFLAVFGTYMVNIYQNNVLLLLLIILISIIVFLVAFDKIPKKMYPLTVFLIAITLLYHTSLISYYLWGWDVHIEYFVSSIVVKNTIWNPMIYDSYNAMLSIVMLAPILSTVCNLDLKWVFKIIYPFLFALVPLGLYYFFSKQINSKIAFLSVFFFMSIFTFYLEMNALAREQIAMIFLVLLLILISEKMETKKWATLFLTFLLSLSIAHYGLSFIYMFYMAIAWLLLFIIDDITIKRLNKKFSWINFNMINIILLYNHDYLKPGKKIIRLEFILIFMVIAFIWYVFISNSFIINSFLDISINILVNITNLLNLTSAEGAKIIVAENQSLLHLMTKVIHLISQFLILIGIIGLLLKPKIIRLKRETFIFAIVSIFLLVACIAVPFFGSALNTERIYQISLIFLAPFVIIGGIISIKLVEEFIINSSDYTNVYMEKTPLSRLKKIRRIKITTKKLDRLSLKYIINVFLENIWFDRKIEKYIKIISIFLIVFFMFNSGFIYEITNDSPTSFSISQKSVKYSDSIDGKINIYNNLNEFEQDDLSSIWFEKNVNINNTLVYADSISYQSLVEKSGIIVMSGDVYPLDSIFFKVEPNSFLFLGYVNTKENLAISSGLPFKVSDIYPILGTFNKIYSNGGGDLYFTG